MTILYTIMPTNVATNVATSAMPTRRKGSGMNRLAKHKAAQINPHTVAPESESVEAILPIRTDAPTMRMISNMLAMAPFWSRSGEGRTAR